MTKESEDTIDSKLEALLFSPGTTSLIFGAGVVHAQYVHGLAAISSDDIEHKLPYAIGGVSAGSLNAAALECVERLIFEKRTDAQEFMTGYFEAILKRSPGPPSLTDRTSSI